MYSYYMKTSLITTFLLLFIIEKCKPFQCPEKFGHYPDSENCSKYYVCDHGRTLEASCDAGLYYNSQLKTCDWPRNVQCDNGEGERVNALTNTHDIQKNSYKKEKSNRESDGYQSNHLNENNDDRHEEEENYDVYDDSPMIEPNYAPISQPFRPPPPPPDTFRPSTREYRPPSAPKSSPKRPNDSPPPIEPFLGFQPDFSPPNPSARIAQPTTVDSKPTQKPKSSEPLRKPDYSPNVNDYEYEPEYDDYEEQNQDLRKTPKEESHPKKVESSSKAPHVKRMGWLPNDRDSIDMDQYHWSPDDAVSFALDKPRIPDEAYVKMRDFDNVEKQLEDDNSPNEGEPPSDDEEEDYEGEEESEPEDYEEPPPPPPPKRKYNYGSEQKPKVVHYDDEDEDSHPAKPPHSIHLGRPPIPARVPQNSDEHNPKPVAKYHRFDSRENRNPSQTPDELKGSRNTNSYINPIRKNPEPVKPVINKKPIINNNYINRNNFNNNNNNNNNNNKYTKVSKNHYLSPILNSDTNKPKGTLIKTIPRTKKPTLIKKTIINPKSDGNQRRKVVNAVQSVTPSVYQIINDFQQELPDAILRHKNFAQDFRDSIIDNYMNNNKPNYILNDKDFDDQKINVPVISGENDDNVRDFNKDFHGINHSNNDKQSSNSNTNKKSLKVNSTDTNRNRYEKTDYNNDDKDSNHRYFNTDMIVKHQRAQDSISSLTTVLPPENIKEEKKEKKSTKKPTFNIIVNNYKQNIEYKPPKKRPPQSSYEEKPAVTTIPTTPRPRITTTKKRIWIKSHKPTPKPSSREVSNDFREMPIRKNPSPQSFENPIGKESQNTYSKAPKCNQDYCTTPDCRCGGVNIPGGLQVKQIPQIVLLTFDDSVNDLNWDIYEDLFNSGRNNPNGCPILGTFYVSHEWTDYSQVQTLYSRGHEMASHSITHSFGEKFSKELWLKEIAGQREILNLYGGVKHEDVRGMRAPFLQTGGNTMFEMLYEANFTYDSSLPVYDINPPFWPYTLDYAINHECMITPCPTKSFPGLWEVGMVMWEDLRGGRCSMADACFNPKDEQGVYEMVRKNFDRHYKTNRSPFGIYFHSRWFLTDHNRKGFMKFLDEVIGMNDVYFVTNYQMIQWMRDPTPLSMIKDFKAWKCDFSDRPQECDRPYDCKVKLKSEVRVLKTCQSCPKVYPWRGINGLKHKA